MGESTERWALRGSLFKRRAVWEPEQRRQHVHRAIRAYARAKRLSRKASYGGLNALAMHFVLAEPRRLRRLQREIDARCAPVEARPPCLTGRRKTEIRAGGVRSGTPDRALTARVASMCDQVVFLAAMTRDERLPCFNPGTAAALEEVAAALSVAPAGPPNAIRTG